MFCLNLMRIALELAKDNPVYEGLASKFLQHYVYVAHAMQAHGRPRATRCSIAKTASSTMSCTHPDGTFRKFRVRSLVGLIPLFAVERLESAWIEPFKEFSGNLDWFLDNRRELVRDVIHAIPGPGGHTTYLLTIVDTDQLAHLLRHIHDDDEFLSRYGMRSLSKQHEASSVRARRPRPSATSPPSPREAQGRQLQLARPDLVPDDVPASSSRCASSAPRSAPHVRVADAELRQHADRHEGDGARHRASDDRHLPARPRQPSPGVRRSGQVSPTTRAGAIIRCSTSTSTATTAPASARATRPDGPHWSPT